MTNTAPPVPTEQGLASRALGIIFSPGATLAGVVARPRPAGILLLSCLVIGLAVSFPQFTERGQQALLETQVRMIERFSGQPVSPEQYEGMRAGVRFAPYTTLAGTLVSAPVFVLLFAAVYWFVFNAILGGMATFKAVLAVVTHSQVIAALSAVLGAPIVYFQSSPSATGPFNLGALVPMLEPNSFLASFLSLINVFLLWQLVVTAIGLAILYRRSARNISIGLIVTYLVLAAAGASVFSSFMGG